MANNTVSTFQPVDNETLLGYMAKNAKDLVSNRNDFKRNYGQNVDQWSVLNNKHIILSSSANIDYRFLEIAEVCVIKRMKRCLWFVYQDVFEDDVEWNPARMALYELQANVLNGAKESTISDLNDYIGKFNISFLSFVLMPEGKELDFFNKVASVLRLEDVDTVLLRLREIPKQEDARSLLTTLRKLRSQGKDVCLGVPLIPGNQNFNSFVSIFKHF